MVKWRWTTLVRWGNVSSASIVSCWLPLSSRVLMSFLEFASRCHTRQPIAG